jgi:hypothetical protein
MKREEQFDPEVSFVAGENRRAFQTLIRALQNRECTAADLTRYIIEKQNDPATGRPTERSAFTQTLSVVLPIRRRSSRPGERYHSLRTDSSGLADPADIPAARWSRIFLAALLALFILRFFFR